MKKVLVSIFCASMILGISAHAEEKVLTAEEAQALFSGKTFDGVNEDNGKAYRVYSAPDGTMIHQNKRRTKEVTWEIDAKGRHCAHFNKKKCGTVVSVGDGVYHKMKGDEHTHTLKNFVDGNQL